MTRSTMRRRMPVAFVSAIARSRSESRPRHAAPGPSQPDRSQPPRPRRCLNSSESSSSSRPTGWPGSTNTGGTNHSASSCGKPSASGSKAMNSPPLRSPAVRPKHKPAFAPPAGIIFARRAGFAANIVSMRIVGHGNVWRAGTGSASTSPAGTDRRRTIFAAEKNRRAKESVSHRSPPPGVRRDAHPPPGSTYSISAGSVTADAVPPGRPVTDAVRSRHSPARCHTWPGHASCTSAGPVTP